MSPFRSESKFLDSGKCYTGVGWKDAVRVPERMGCVGCYVGETADRKGVWRVRESTEVK